MSSISQRFGNLSPLKQALLALEEMGERLAKSERERLEPIAIIGTGCRFPGAVDPAAFWRLMENGVDAVKEIPASRWSLEELYDADPDAPGKMSSRWAGLLDSIDTFDPEFFGISPREAIAMDPQQRLLLEVAWEALENAGQGPRALAQGQTGVFIGMTGDEYAQLFYQAGDLAVFNTYFASGIARSVASGRISYVLGLQGPNLSIDTACSSSLVAVHTACLNLRMGECRVAIAGGSNIVLSPEVGIAFSKAHMMAPDGRCKTFDSRADGFVRGEGCGIVVLKRLSDAVVDSDNILAVIRGSAVNQDGRSSGLTVPNAKSQEGVIRQALANGGVKPEEISFVEAHGTGTSLGDPIEAHALAAVLGPGRTPENPLVVGSVKTNVGHLESTAGVAGLIKLVLSLQHEKIPANLHFQKMNPHIDWSGMPVEIPVAPRTWNRADKKRIAGVSAFGFSGTNAHVVVEEAPARKERARGLERPLHVLGLSARSETALKELEGRYAAALGNSIEALGDICFTANLGRIHFEHRSSVVGATVQEVRRKLQARKTGTEAQERGGVRPVFLFSGQGAQYAGMGKQLYDTQPVFRKAIEECEELLKGELETPLREVMWGATTEVLEQTAYTQPALFALEYAMSEMWKSWGIVPGVVLGHSVGEYVAACVAGVYSLADGMKLIAARARLMQRVGGRGAMAAVMAQEERVREALQGLEARVSIAGLNAPESVVISGYAEEVGIAEAKLREGGVRVQRLAVSHGFHSPQMAEMEGEFEAIANEIKYAAPRVKLISSVTGKEVGREEIRGSYWRGQVREPVRYQKAMETLRESGQRVFVEVGPGTTLIGLGKQSVEGQEETGKPERLWAVSIRKSKPDWEQILESLGKLYERGAEVDWEGFDRGYARRRVELPTYPFQRQRYWIETGPQKAARSITKSNDDLGADIHDNWLYRVAWQEKSLPDSPAVSLKRHFLLLPDATGVAEKLTAKIRTAGCSYSVINEASDLENAVIDSTASSIAIVDLRFLDASDIITSRQSCMSVANSIRALSGIEQSGLRYWIVTHGAQATGVNKDKILPWQAPAWGLGRALASENSEFWGGVVDLDPAQDAAKNSEQLWSHLISVDGAEGEDREDQAALRGGRRLVARLERQVLSSSARPWLHGDATYVITGGFGGLGPELARWMVAHGARRLILMGRTPLPPRSDWNRLSGSSQARAISAIREMEELGATIRAVSIDVGDSAALRQFFADYKDECDAPIRGVVHAAGILQHTLVADAAEENFRELFRAKVDGGWNLHEVLSQAPLDFFILFSSASSVLSSPRLGPYAAANSFLDALAAYRTSIGMPALSVNWGAWSETGMGVRSDASSVRELGERGMGGIKTAEGLYCLGRLLSARVSQCSVLPVDWQKWAERYPAYMENPFLASIAQEVASSQMNGGRDVASSVVRNKKNPVLLEQLENAPESNRLSVVRDFVHATAVSVLGFSADRQIDSTLPLNGFGLDSLMALEFRNALSRGVARPLPATLLFSYPAIEDVSNYLVRLLFGAAIADASSAAAGGSDEVLENIEDLSDEEVERRLTADREVTR
jgi:acyl transferase domain-containing protein